MGRWYGLVLVSLLALSMSWGQQLSSSDDAASRGDIEKLFVVLHTRERAQIILDNGRQETKKIANDMLRRELPEESQDALLQYQGMINEMVDGIEKDYPVDEVLQDMVPVYQRHLTKSDTEALIAFYSSPVGQKMLRELPAITSESLKISNAHLEPRLAAAIGKVKERVLQMEEDQKKKKSDSAPAKPETK